METIHDAIDRLRAEYQEMPGMCLTAEQVQRLCGLEPAVCREVLGSLVAAKFLRMSTGGRYLRQGDGEPPTPPSPRPARRYPVAAFPEKRGPFPAVVARHDGRWAARLAQESGVGVRAFRQV